MTGSNLSTAWKTSSPQSRCTRSLSPPLRPPSLPPCSLPATSPTSSRLTRCSPHLVPGIKHIQHIFFLTADPPDWRLLQVGMSMEAGLNICFLMLNCSGTLMPIFSNQTSTLHFITFLPFNIFISLNSGLVLLVFQAYLCQQNDKYSSLYG